MRQTFLNRIETPMVLTTPASVMLSAVTRFSISTGAKTAKHEAPITPVIPTRSGKALWNAFSNIPLCIVSY